MASLKTIGFSGRTIRLVYLLLYGGSILFGLFLGIVCCKPVAILIERKMVSSTGFLIEVKIPWKEVLILFGIYSIVLLFFLFIYTMAILKTAPMETLQMKAQIQKSNSCICKKLLMFSIAVRSVLSEKPKYISLCFIAISLTIFLSIFGRMITWLGIHGEGLMNAFSVADHDIGVQPLNHSIPMDEIERAINWYSPIVEIYELVMQPVIVNGKEYTANVLNDITWFDILKGSVCDGDSILITDTVAKELSLEIGDSVKISANGRVEEYFISGIYQCANGMGTNIGMSLEGYSKIGDITGFIFCYHYILEDGSMRDYIYEYLEEHYQGIDVHTNRWSGLDDIVFLMHSLLIILYFFAALLIFISVSFISRKLLQSEKGAIAIYRSLGFGISKLRISFLLRFLLIVLLGTGIGLMIAETFADTLVGLIFRKFGISEFVIGISILGTLVPALMIVFFFGFSTWVSSAKLSKIRVIELLSESE